MGFLLRRISQHQESGPLPVRETTTKNDRRGEGRSMTNPDSLNSPGQRSGSGPFAGANICLFHRGFLETGLKAIADARFGDEKAGMIRVGLDFLPQFADENAQVLNVVTLVAGPYFLEQLIVRHHEADMRRQNMAV